MTLKNTAAYPIISFMMKALFILTFFMINEIRAQELEVPIPWECLQTQNSAVPIETNIYLKINTQTQTYDLKNFDELIVKAEADPGYDYFSCFMNFQNRANIILWDAGETNLSLKIAGALAAKSSLYAQKIFNKSLPSPFGPGNKSLSKISPEEIVRMNHKISTLCAQTIPGIKDRTRRELFLDQSYIQDHLPNEIKRVPKDSPCIKNIAAFYLAALNESQCPGTQEKCDDRKKSIKQTIKELERIPSLKDHLRNAKKQIEECAPDDPFALNEFVSELSYSLQCTELKAGETKAISGDYGSGISSQYILSKKIDQSGKTVFKAIIPVLFTGADLFNDKLQKKAQSCFDEIASDLEGPDGEKLEVLITPPDDSGLVINTINVSESAVRANSQNWNPQISCRTIVHEIFHLLGLVDEYQETSIGTHLDENDHLVSHDEDTNNMAYNCRTIGPKDSVMSNQDEAFRALKSNTSLLVCQCPLGGGGGFGGYSTIPPASASDCEQKLKSQNNLKTCPAPSNAAEFSFNEIDLKENTFLKMVAETYKTDEFQANPASRVIKRETIPPKRKNLLYPAQFRYITNPGCLQKNRLYQLCSGNAYKTNKKNLGTGCKMGLPKECQEGGSAWLK